MYKWYNKKAKKNTIIGYLSRKYTEEELTQLTSLELPVAFGSTKYFLELNQVLEDFPGKKVNYVSDSSWKDYFFGKKPLVAKVSEAEIEQYDELSLKTDASEEEIIINEERLNEVKSRDNNSDLGVSVYFDANPFGVLSDNANEKTASDNNSLKSAEVELKKDDNASLTSNKTEKELTTPKVEEPNFSWKQPRIYTYEFLTNDQGIIFLWKAWVGNWQAPFIKDIYFDSEKEYYNAWIKIQVLEKLPLLKLPEEKDYFFEPVANQEEMIKKNNWVNCFVEESKELSTCSQCSNYFLAEDDKDLCNVCEETFLDSWNLHSFTREEKQEWLNTGFSENEANLCWWLQNVKQVSPEWVLNNGDKEQLKKEHRNYLIYQGKKNFWEDNKNLLIIGGVMVLAIIIYQYSE